MNEREELLLLLMEELSEVAQAASKMIRFGDSDSYKGITNLENLNIEWNDVLAIAKLLKDHGIELREDKELQDIKLTKLKKWRAYSCNKHKGKRKHRWYLGEGSLWFWDEEY